MVILSRGILSGDIVIWGILSKGVWEWSGRYWQCILSGGILPGGICLDTEYVGNESSRFHLHDQQ